MAVSSGTYRLFSTLAFCVAAMGGAAIGLQNKETVRDIFFKVTGVPLALPGPGPLTAARAPSDDDDGADRAWSGDVTLRAADGGHFVTSADINGRSVDVMVDTGATTVAMTYEDAQRAGIYVNPSDFTYQVSTANGVAKVAPVDIGSISIGSITVRNVRGAVVERGKMDKTLLGMTFLGRLSGVEMRRDTLILRE